MTVVTTILLIPQLIFLCFAEDLLIFFGQPKESSKYAGEYIIAYLPGMWAYSATEILRRFLASQGVFDLMVKVQLITLIIHVWILFLFVNALEMGIIGIAYSLAINHNLTFFSCIAYIWYNQSIVKEGSWIWLTKDSFKGFAQYIKVGFPSMLMIIFEVWAFEAMFIMAGTIDADVQGATVIQMNTVAIMFMTCLGVASATASLVGNNLGAGKPELAKLYAKASIAFSLFLSIIFFSFWNIFKTQIAYIYTNHENIIKLIEDITFLSALFIALDVFQGTMGGSIRAMGYQVFASISSILNYWVFAIPLTYILAFWLDLGIYGIWMGMPIGIAIVDISYKLITNIYQLIILCNIFRWNIINHIIWKSFHLIGIS